MPEGDTVHRTAERLRPMIGHVITSARARPGPGLRRVPDLSRLVGARVLSVEARGKHLLIGFEGGLTLRSHLRMTGSWRLLPAPAPRPLPHRSTAIIESSAWTAIALATPVIELLTDAELRGSEPLRSLGPDLLAAELDADEAIRRLRLRDRDELGNALLDQRAVAGIGNVYKSEVAFLEGLDPWSPVGACTDAQLRSVLATARRLLLANLADGRRSTTGRRTPGQRLWVYRRSGRPCRRCGSPIRSRPQGSPPRLTWWCPRCQPALADPSRASVVHAKMGTP
jgi:endonuclease-8